MESHFGSSRISEYLSLNISGPIDEDTASSILSSLGQISASITGTPSLECPIGSDSKSISRVPERA